MRQNPIRLIGRAARLCMQGRVRRWGDLSGLDRELDGERFAAFRKVGLRAGPGQPEAPGAVFLVRFRFRNLGERANRLLSLIPIPLILAQPGFRSKTWLLGEESRDFAGHYEFDRREQAEAYRDSLPLRMMKRRADSASLSHEIRDASGRTK